MEHRDEHITCAECGTTFVFTAAEADSFASKKLEPPKRCFECRRARRAQRGATGPRDAAPRGQFGGDVNGYRSPMSDPGASRGTGRRDGEYRAPGFRDSAPAYGNRPGAGQRSAQPSGARGEYRAPSFGGDPGARGGGEYRAPAFGGDRGAPRGGLRGGPPGAGAPGGGFRRGPQRSGDGRGPGQGPRGPRDQDARAPQSGGYDRGPHSSRQERGAAPGGQERGPQSGGHERGPRRAQGERPSFPITCAQCGAASEVPFKPQEGREILCRDCYRAKKEAG